MNGKIEIPFAIGAKVWHVSPTVGSTTIVCPECCGKKTVKLTIGTGESFDLDCACCTLGMGMPTGTVQRQSFEYTPREYVCNRVELSGSRVSYSESSPEARCFQYADAGDLFADRDECLRACTKKNAERREQEEKNANAILQSKRKGLAWSVHYWTSKVADLERDLERARALLGKSKEKEARKSSVAQS